MSEVKGIGQFGNGEKIHGVGVLRIHNGAMDIHSDHARILEIAKGIAANITQGTILILPDTKDHLGTYVWDFRIEGGNPEQVQIQRGSDDPIIVPIKD